LTGSQNLFTGKNFPKIPNKALIKDRTAPETHC